MWDFRSAKGCLDGRRYLLRFKYKSWWIRMKVNRWNVWTEHRQFGLGYQWLFDNLTQQDPEIVAPCLSAMFRLDFDILRCGQDNDITTTPGPRSYTEIIEQRTMAFSFNPNSISKGWGLWNCEWLNKPKFTWPNGANLKIFFLGDQGKATWNWYSRRSGFGQMDLERLAYPVGPTYFWTHQRTSEMLNNRLEMKTCITYRSQICQCLSLQTNMYCFSQLQLILELNQTHVFQVTGCPKDWMSDGTGSPYSTMPGSIHICGAATKL